jgi:hypothetical protein
VETVLRRRGIDGIFKTSRVSIEAESAVAEQRRRVREGAVQLFDAFRRDFDYAMFAGENVDKA